MTSPAGRRRRRHAAAVRRAPADDAKHHTPPQRPGRELGSAHRGPGTRRAPKAPSRVATDASAGDARDGELGASAQGPCRRADRPGAEARRTPIPAAYGDRRVLGVRFRGVVVLWASRAPRLGQRPKALFHGPVYTGDRPRCRGSLLHRASTDRPRRASRPRARVGTDHGARLATCSVESVSTSAGHGVRGSA